MRFEISLPTCRRRELDALTVETGLSASDLARLAITRMLNQADTLTGRKAILARDAGNRIAGFARRHRRRRKHEAQQCSQAVGTQKHA